MTTNTKPNSAVNSNTSTTAPSSSEGADKPKIKMSPAHGALTALHALAASYRGLIDLLRELRQTQIHTLKDFTEQAWQKGYDAAKDSRHALIMQGTASIVGGGIAGAGAIGKFTVSSTARGAQEKAAGLNDFCKTLKTDLTTARADAVIDIGDPAAPPPAANTVSFNQLPANTREAVTLIRNNQFDILKSRQDPLTNNPITNAQRQAAMNYIRHGVDGGNHAQVLEKLDEHINRYANEMNTASNMIAQQAGYIENFTTLAKDTQHGGFTIKQAQDTEKSRQEEADATRTSQSQKLADQSQSDFGGSMQEAARDLRSISEQIGRIVPQRG